MQHTQAFLLPSSLRMSEHPTDTNPRRIIDTMARQYGATVLAAEPTAEQAETFRDLGYERLMYLAWPQAYRTPGGSVYYFVVLARSEPWFTPPSPGSLVRVEQP